MATFFAVCWVNGPISRELNAESIEDAVAQFEAADTRSWIDNAETDAEDALDIDGADGMDEAEFDAAMQAAGCEMVRDLEPIHNYHAGTTSHLSGGWMLWQHVGTNDDLICGNCVQVDHSGVGHNWVNVTSDSLPAHIRLEIEGEMIDGGKGSCEDYTASNGVHYRW